MFMRRDAPGKSPEGTRNPRVQGPARPLQTANPYIAFCGRMPGAGRADRSPPGTTKPQASPERPGAEIGGMFDNGCYVIRPSAKGLHNTRVIRLPAAAGRKGSPERKTELVPARSLFLLCSCVLFLAIKEAPYHSGTPGRPRTAAPLPSHGLFRTGARAATA